MHTLESLAAATSTPPGSTCWIWSHHVDKYGYGRVYFRTQGALAHRAAYELKHGPIPDGMTVDHLCFTTACINPDHLRLLTRLENQKNQRCARWTHCSNGHEFTSENTYDRSESTGGQRQCRACNRAAARRYKARKVGAHV